MSRTLLLPLLRRSSRRPSNFQAFPLSSCSSSSFVVNEEWASSNAFGKKKSSSGFGKVSTPARPSSALTTPHVFVTNLRKGTRYQLLRQHMSQVGEVKYARVYTKREKEYSNAMVEYYRLEDAQKALKMMHGSELEGNSLWVREYRERNAPSVNFY